MRFYTVLLVVSLQFAWTIQAQVVVFTARETPAGPFQLYQIDLATCQFCPVITASVGALPSDALVLPNGNVLVSANGFIRIYSPPNTTPITTLSGNWLSVVMHPNGTIYGVIAPNVLATIDPVSFATTVIGTLPAVSVDALFLVGSTLYGFGFAGSGTRPVYEINTITPSASVVVHNVVNTVSSATTASNGQVITTWVGGSSGPPAIDFAAYDLTTNTQTTLCQTSLIQIGALAAVPTGVTIPCGCAASSAGTPFTPNASTCEPNDYTANFNNDTQLDPNDGINYILCTDQANPLTSVLFQNATGVFSFSPPLQTDITYYVFRIVGDINGGVVSLADPCLDISPSVAVIWRPKPTLVSMNAANFDLCPNQCQTINLSFTGTPPFTFNWQWQQGGTSVSPTISGNNILTNTPSFVTCVPPGLSGNVSIVLCGITDLYCINQP